MSYISSIETYELEEKLFKEMEKAKGFKKLALIIELQGLLSMAQGQ